MLLILVEILRILFFLFFNLSLWLTGLLIFKWWRDPQLLRLFICKSLAFLLRVLLGLIYKKSMYINFLIYILNLLYYDVFNSKVYWSHWRVYLGSILSQNLSWVNFFSQILLQFFSQRHFFILLQIIIHYELIYYLNHHLYLVNV